MTYRARAGTATRRVSARQRRNTQTTHAATTTGSTARANRFGLAAAAGWPVARSCTQRRPPQPGQSSPVVALRGQSGEVAALVRVDDGQEQGGCADRQGAAPGPATRCHRLRVASTGAVAYAITRGWSGVRQGGLERGRHVLLVTRDDDRRHDLVGEGLSLGVPVGPQVADEADAVQDVRDVANERVARTDRLSGGLTDQLEPDDPLAQGLSGLAGEHDPVEHPVADGGHDRGQIGQEPETTRDRAEDRHEDDPDDVDHQDRDVVDEIGQHTLDPLGVGHGRAGGRCAA